MVLGVEQVKTDAGANKLTVTGKVDAAALKAKLEERIRKKVDLVSPQPAKKEGGGEGGGDKKKAEEKSEKPSEKKAEEKKPADKPKEKEAPKEVKIIINSFLACTTWRSSSQRGVNFSLRTRYLTSSSLLGGFRARSL